MAIDPFNLKRINPGDEDYNRVAQHWWDAGKPRRFSYSGIDWMQILDNADICFIPTAPANDMKHYDSSSFSREG